MLKWFKIYMIFIGICGQASFFLQFATIIRHHSAANVSLPGFICWLVSMVSWLIYGIVMKDKVLIIANIVATIGAALNVAAILIYA